MKLFLNLSQEQKLKYLVFEGVEIRHLIEWFKKDFKELSLLQ